MGLLDFLKKKLQGADATQVEKAVNDVAQEVEEHIPEPQQSAAPQRKADISNAQFEEKMDAIIERNFDSAQYRKNVPASELDPSCHPACTPIQYLFYREDKPVLAVVLVRQNNYRGMNVKGTQHICEAADIVYMRFFKELTNEEAYVANRINEYLH